ncbi:type II toxin-antitoxin system HipA family toxin [Achromobacter pestifer]
MSNAKIKKLEISTPQGESGLLQKESRFVFNYTHPGQDREISLIMPHRAESYADTVLPPIFAMNRPEGYLYERLWERFGKDVELDDMRLLALTGSHQIGRLRYHEPGREVIQLRPEVGLSALLTSGASIELFEHLVNAYLTSGISGFQPKVLMPDADATDVRPIVDRSTTFTPDLIVKAAGEDYPFLAQNEFLCMSAARKAGIRVPDFWLSGDGSLFVMRRFDLDNGQQLGFEDMAVLLRKSAKEKYLSSYETVAEMIGLLCGENRTESLARYFEYVTLSVQVRNGDAHLKNFGLLYRYPGATPAELAPLYDVVTTSVYEVDDPQSGRKLSDRTLALKMNKKRQYPTRKALLQFGRTVCGVAHPEAVIERIATAMEEVLRDEAHRIDDGFLAKIKGEWDGGAASLLPARVITGSQAASD